MQMANNINKSVKERHGTLLFLLITVAFALFLLANIRSELRWLEEARFERQPGFWAAVGVIGMVVFGMAKLANVVVRNVFSWTAEWGEAAVWLRSLEFGAWYMAYVYLVPIIGYLPATLLVTLLLSLRMGFDNKRTLWSAAAFAVAVVLLFKTFLQVKIPGGTAYEYLPDAIRNFLIVNF